MTITFNTETQLELVCGYDEKKDLITESRNERFRTGETVQVEIFEEFEEKGEKFVNLEFDDGSFALGVKRDTFTIL